MPVKMRGASADGERDNASSMRGGPDLDRHDHASSATGARLVPLRGGKRRVHPASRVGECKDGTSEARPDQAGAVDTALRAERVGQDIELQGRDLEILAQRGVRRIDERAAPREVARS